MRHKPRRRSKTLLWILRRHPALDRMTVPFHIFLCESQTFAVRDSDLPLHQINSGHCFRDRVLHLNPGIHFHKIEISFRGIDEFHCAGIGVSDRRRRLYRRRADALALFRRKGC